MLTTPLHIYTQEIDKKYKKKNKLISQNWTTPTGPLVTWNKNGRVTDELVMNMQYTYMQWNFITR